MYNQRVRSYVVDSRRKFLLAVQVLGWTTYRIWRQRHLRRITYNRLDGAALKERERIRNELMTYISTSERSFHVIRMHPSSFKKLCLLLRRDGGLNDTQRSSVEEQVAKFLHILSHNMKMRAVSFYFRRGASTISRHFHKVLNSILTLEDKFLRQPSGTEIEKEILENNRFFPYFKDCIGAIDGTHVRVKVAKDDERRYRGRKGFPTQNVLAACSFDLKFTYVLPGWEGTASDSRIIKNALTRDDNLKIPEGKYYLVDAGYMHKSGLMAPYRSVRYHLKEYSTRAPENAKELFNLRHASLRNAIERAFGVLKKRFSIIASMTEPQYSVNVTSDIVLACCILHNYLMTVDPIDDLLAEVDEEIMNQTPTTWISSDEDSSSIVCDRADVIRAEYLRDQISQAMWNDYRRVEP